MKLSNLVVALMACFVFQACEKPFEYSLDEIPSDFDGLEAPVLGEGYQIHVPPFPVPADFEREWFMRMAFGNTEEIYANRFLSKCRPGTHHLIAYGYEDENDPNNPEIGVMRDQNRADGRANFKSSMSGDLAYFISQNADFELQLPEGMAIKIPENATVDMNSHYFNKTDKTLFGEVYLNTYVIPEAEVTEALVIEDIDNDSEGELVLPPKQTTIITYTEMFDEITDIRMMVSHMHKRGKLFEVFKVGGANDGQKLYSANDYQHPPTLFFSDSPLVILEGEGLRTEVTYENETNRTIRFGVTSEDEMGILFYMKKDN